MRAPLRSLAVFAGSNPGSDPAYATVAKALGDLLVEREIHLVYGGAQVGLMGIVADTVLEAGGKVTGVIPRDLFEKEVAHLELTELLVVDTMHERKLAIADRSQAFVALPGGTGTLEEVLEVFTWTQLGIHHKPVGVLEAGGFYAPLLAFLDSMVGAGFVRQEHRDQFLAATDPADLLAQLTAWEPVEIAKWLDFDDR